MIIKIQIFVQTSISSIESKAVAEAIEEAIKEKELLTINQLVEQIIPNYLT